MCKLDPWEFDRSVLVKGTTTAICDPHEISNVLGTKGLDYFFAAAEDLAICPAGCIAGPTTVPTGLEPGDRYRLAFVTSNTTTPTSTPISLR